MTKKQEAAIIKAVKAQWPSRECAVENIGNDPGDAYVVIATWDGAIESDGKLKMVDMTIAGTYGPDATPEYIVSDLVGRERLYGPTIVPHED